ncbi:hypothetical protein NO135_23475, partial [Clostridioides difficile]|nr:hypothetical protein [Clostridioides difficile]
ADRRADLHLRLARGSHRPWQTAYASTSILSGPLKFVLGASGHIAGVINPPAKKTRSYGVNARDLPESADDWFAGAAAQPG